MSTMSEDTENSMETESHLLPITKVKLEELSPDEDSSEPPPGNENEMHMFATAWVKVEVNEGDVNEDSEYSEEPKPTMTLRTNPRPSKPGTKKRNFPILHCEQCDYKTKYKNSLKLHIMDHDNFKPHACTMCGYMTKYPTSLYRHMLIQHQYKHDEAKKVDIKLYECDDCEYTTYFKWNLNAHRRKHNTEKQFKCAHCPYSTAYRHNYLKHSKTHNKQTVNYKCDKCPFTTKFEGHITRHLAKIHNEVSEKANRCDFCDFSTKTKWRLNIHKQRSRQEETIKCVYCDFQSYYTCEIKKHKVNHYNEIYCLKNVLLPKKDQKNKANHVDSKRGNISDTQTDMQHSSECQDGDYQRTPHELSKNYLLDPNCEWQNIQVLESANKDRPFQCIRCKYTSKFKASVQRHYQRHHTGSNNRPFKCVNCDFSTKTKDQIALHNKRSQSELQLHCAICDFSTFFKCQYVLHQKCHNAHRCTLCDYSCKHKHEIQKHFATMHLGDGLKCKYCDYKASRKESLLCHETIHTGDKPFKCSFCDYQSVRKSLLENHLKRYHHQLIKKEVMIVSDSKIQSLIITPDLDCSLNGDL